MATLISEVETWKNIIATYDREFKKWEGRTKKIVKRYRDERSTSDDRQARFNILWSNVETLIPAVYAKTPEPEVSRKFGDRDDVGRVASLILERALKFETEHYPDFRDAMRFAVQDRFLGGRGIAWLRYEPHVETVPFPDGMQVTEDVDADGGQYEQLTWECTPVDYVNWEDFGHAIARTWEEVTAVWRMVYLDRDALVARFGEELGNKIPLDSAPDDFLKNTNKNDQVTKALIYEIWDKDTKTVVWLCKSYPQILDKQQDPYGLEEFFPCPRPLYGTLTSETLIPVPDFTMYQDQANELDRLAETIDGLIQMIKVTGVYNAAIPELKRLFTEGENGNLIPVTDWGLFSEKGGIAGAVDIVPVKDIADALNQCYLAREQIKAEVYEITGLSDILRGATQASETATAQQIKSNFVSLRLKETQRAVAEFASEILRIKAQIICANYQPRTLLMLSAADQLKPTDQQLVPQALQLLSNEPLRSFRISVATDSLIQLDEAQERSDRTEFIKAFGGLLQQALPAIQSAPQVAPIVIELMKYGITAFNGAKTLEGTLDAQLDQIMEMQQQQQGLPKPPDPEMLKVQAESQAKQQEMQMKFQLDQQHLKNQMDLEQSKQYFQAQQLAHQNELEAQRDALAARNEMALETMRLQFERQMQGIEGQLQMLIAQMNNAAKIEVAEIGASTTLQTAQIAAANNAEGRNDA